MDAGWIIVVKDQGKVISYDFHFATWNVLIVYGAGRETKVKRGRQKADDREQRASLIRGAKAIRGSQSRGVSK
jgi:agmatine/peptidylarginine deiminase